MPWDKWVYGITIGQRYLIENTTLGIPAIVQSEGVLFPPSFPIISLFTWALLSPHMLDPPSPMLHNLPFVNR